MSKLFTLFVGLTALATPIQASVHDFDPARPPRTATAPRTTVNGNCYTTKDESKICVMKLGKQRFSVAIQDSAKPEYPSTVLVDCNTRKYYSFGNLTKRELAAYTGAICEDNT